MVANAELGSASKLLSGSNVSSRESRQLWLKSKHSGGREFAGAWAAGLNLAYNFINYNFINFAWRLYRRGVLGVALPRRATEPRIQVYNFINLA